MTFRTTRIFRCLGCGLEQELEVWETVNISLNPELKPKVLSGKLFDFKCGDCVDWEVVTTGDGRP